MLATEALVTTDRKDAVASLRRWTSGAVIADATYARMLSDPRLPSAIQAIAQNTLTAGESDKALDGIFKDAGRYFAAMLVMYLHASGQLTLPTLKAYCTTSGLLSPGRGRALLSYLRYLNFIVLLPAELRRGPAQYVPTDELLVAWRSHLHAMLEGAQYIEPAVQVVRDRIHDPEIFNVFVRMQTEEMIGSIAHSTQVDHPFMQIIVHRHAGTQILLSLLGASPDFPPTDPIPLSVAATAQRFRVSRIHVQRMLDQAEREGLIRRGDRGAIVFEESAKNFMRYSIRCRSSGF